MASVPYTLDQFYADMERLTQEEQSPEKITNEVAQLLPPLLRSRNCVPAPFRKRPSGGIGRYMLHRAAHFNVTAVVWGPGDGVEPHNHGTWGIIGVIENEIEETRYTRANNGRLQLHTVLHNGPGAISRLVPPNDVHAMRNRTQRDTVEVHIYGRDLVGLPRQRYTGDGEPVLFASPKYLNC